jgi:hypothetical protein
LNIDGFACTRLLNSNQELKLESDIGRPGAGNTMKIFIMIRRTARWYIQAVTLPLTEQEEAEFLHMF